MQPRKIRVLVVDDDPVDIDLAARALAKVEQPSFEVARATSLAEATERLREQPCDVALLDLGLPDSPRHETLPRFRAIAGGHLPVVVLTGLCDEPCDLEALDHGAQDYLAKDEVSPDLLSRSIRYAMQRHQLIGQIEARQEELQQKNQRLAQLYDTAQQFVENVSHEFRTPLTVIREFASIMLDGLDGEVTPRQAEHLEKILHRTDDLALMVDDMLDISRLEAGLLGAWRRRVRIEELIESVREFLATRAAAKGISLGMRCDTTLPEVYCDEEKARRVLINLAVNAIKFTPEGGTVEFWANPGENGNDVTVGVTDSGPGISDENLALIFERFQQVDLGLTTSVKGFGLGLNIAKELVQLNLGQIHVRNEQPHGTTFLFTIPVCEPQTIFACYLDRVESLYANGVGAVSDRESGGAANSTAVVSLLVVECDPEADCASASVIDEFLQRSVRLHDLVIAPSPREWLIAATCLESDCGRMIERLEGEWANFVRNFPDSPLPSLSFAVLGTWSIHRQRSELIRTALSRFRPPDDRDGSCSGLPRADSRRTILVVDDDREVSQCLKVRLQSAGYEVVSAVDGEEGMTAALDLHPDAVVLDVRMPKKDGLEVLKELRSEESMRNTPIVMLSASIRDQHQALEAGASYFVPKPYEAKQVLTALESSMRVTEGAV